MAVKNSTGNYISSFIDLLPKAAPATISPEPYCCRYLSHLLDHAQYYLAIYSAVLDKVLSCSTVSKEQSCILDVGAGNGLLGIFAKYCGFGKVCLNDIDPAFTAASRELASRLEINIDDYITGDIDTVQQRFLHEKPTAIIGTDVIEHIYDLSAFFNRFTRINPNMVSVFTTAANPHNYFKVRQLRKLQLKDEHEGGTPGDSVLFGSQPHEAFARIREKIICTEAPELDAAIVQQLVKATRGFNKTDIIAAVNDYKSSVKIPNTIADTTNTCNPITGSWTERILSLEEYKSLYTSNNFRLDVYDGFYDQYKKGIKGKIAFFSNKIIPIFGHQFAPFLIFVGFRN